LIPTPVAGRCSRPCMARRSRLIVPRYSGSPALCVEGPQGRWRGRMFWAGMILPGPLPGCAVDRVIRSPDQLVIVAHRRRDHGRCPSCGTPSYAVHSRYDRHPADLPSFGRAGRLRLLMDVHFDAWHLRPLLRGRPPFRVPARAWAMAYLGSQPMIEKARRPGLIGQRHPMGVVLQTGQLGRPRSGRPFSRCGPVCPEPPVAPRVLRRHFSEHRSRIAGSRPSPPPGATASASGCPALLHLHGYRPGAAGGSLGWYTGRTIQAAPALETVCEWAKPLFRRAGGA
jgi:hypothetical protein